MQERERFEKRKQKRLKRAQRMERENPPVRPIPTPPGLLAFGLVAADAFTRRYNLHGQEILSSYGHDVLAIPALWVLSQKVLPRVNFFRTRANIALLTALSVGFEVMEYELAQNAPHILEQHLEGSARFDPNDFIAYGVGTAITLGLHKFFYGRSISPRQTETP